MTPATFPPYVCGLALEHNENRNYYQTVAEFEKDYADRNHPLDWVSKEQRDKAIKTNELWNLHWYPNTPISFHSVYAADLDVLLEACSKPNQEWYNNA